MITGKKKYDKGLNRGKEHVRILYGVGELSNRRGERENETVSLTSSREDSNSAGARRRPLYKKNWF